MGRNSMLERMSKSAVKMIAVKPGELNVSTDRRVEPSRGYPDRKSYFVGAWRLPRPDIIFQTANCFRHSFKHYFAHHFSFHPNQSRFYTHFHCIFCKSIYFNLKNFNCKIIHEIVEKHSISLTQFIYFLIIYCLSINF